MSKNLLVRKSKNLFFTFLKSVLKRIYNFLEMPFRNEYLNYLKFFIYSFVNSFFQMYSLSILRKSVISVCLASTLIISYLTSQISIDREYIKKISLKYIETSCHKFMRLHLDIYKKSYFILCSEAP